MLRRLFLAMVAVALLVPPAPASATSCAVPAPLPSLQAADGAIVGEALAHGEDGAIRFAVRERIKGDVGDVVELPGAEGRATNSDLGYLGPGTVTGLYLRREAGAWHAGVCDQVAPAGLRAAARADRAGERCRVPRVANVRVQRMGRLVRLVVRAEDRDGRPTSVQASFGDGISERRRITPRRTHSGVAAFGHRFRAARTYVVSLWAFADAGALCGGSEFSARRRLRVDLSAG